MEQQVDENSNNSLLDLPENLLLHHILSEFAAAPHTLLHFSCTCKQANRLVNAPGLWASFCQASMANELAGCFADPELWRAASHKQLWIGLLLPFGQLLGRLWHSTTAPSGMLLAVDAEAPRLVARSIYYKTLNGGPFCHDVFAVELPGPDSKAVVTCWRDKHSADTFEGQAQLAPAAVAATGSAKSWTTAGTPAAVEESRIRPSGICPCSSSSSVVANLSTGFKLCCPGRCDSCAVEIASRRFASQQYAAAGQQHTAELLRQQASAHPPSSSGASGVISSSSAGGAAADSSSSGRILAQQQQQPHGELAPLPEMQQASTIDLFHIISLADMRNSFATPVFRPLDLSPWLPAAPMQAAARTGSNAAAAGSSVIAAGAAAAEAEVAEACAAASAAALSLPGCWRGTYGTHAIELVQLQLLLAPPGYDMFAAPAADGDAAAAAPAAAAGLDAADALAADSTADAAPGVLLGGVAGLASTAARHTGAAADAATADADEQQQQQDAAPVELEATQEQQQQQQRQQRQPLLVATKLTGDVNVPAGAVTFAADLGSRCSAGVGSRLVLPPGFDSDVQLNRAGMRQLRVKERYRGRAQIAYAEFDRPQVIAAELVLFDSPDCVGLLWKRPMDSFSLFSRASQLPRVPQA